MSAGPEGSASGVAVPEPNIWYPATRAPGETGSLVFHVKGDRRWLEKRAVDTLERVDADYGISLPVDLACDYGHHTALLADVEPGSLRAEDILRDVGRVSNGNGKATGRTGSPHASVFGAKRARARARGNLGWLGFPQ